jgi:hypothetical protein
MTVILVLVLVSGLFLMAAVIWLFTVFPEAFTGSIFAWPLVASGVLVVYASVCGLTTKSRRERCYWAAVLVSVLMPLIALFSVPAWGSTGDGGFVGIVLVAIASAPLTISGAIGCICSAVAKKPLVNEVEQP